MCASTKPTAAAGTKFHKQNVCLVTAHPDDECMFFGPVMRQLSLQSNKIFILCMTTGNYDKLGAVRTKELKSSCVNLIGQSNLMNVEIVDEPELPDHPNLVWNKELCGSLINKYVASNSIDVVITFDQFGVSKHPNHCFLYHTISDLKFSTPVRVFYLQSVSLVRKYMLIFDTLPTLLDTTSKMLVFSSPSNYLVIFRSMLKHRSQLVWFRWLYILSSRYMVINSLRESR